jgi:hypothetical protein
MIAPAAVAEPKRSSAAPQARATMARATAAPVPAIARVLPSLTDLAFVMPLIFLFAKLDGARILLYDGDTGWHIRTGEWILAHHRVPYVDLFSFTRAGRPWFAWEWLWDTIFALIHQRWGLGGVVLGSLAVICLTSAGLFRLVRRKCNNGLVAIAVTLLAAGACSIHWLARPHLFTLLFLVGALHITERAAEGRTHLLAWLLPLTLVWTNMHGGFFVIFLLLACYTSSDLLNALIEPNALLRRRFLKNAMPWVATFGACFLVTFINPYGWGLHRHVFQYLSDPYQLEHIAEFQALNFRSGAQVYFEPLVFLALLTALWDAQNRRFADVFMCLGWLHLALIAQRNLPIFAIATAPILARGMASAVAAARTIEIAGWVRRGSAWFESVSTSFEETDRLWRVHLASVVPLAVIGLLLVLPRPVSAKLSPVQDPKWFPAGALTVVRKPEAERVFTTDQWGDYLIYNLYPSKKVFIDGRSDFYGDKFGQLYLDAMGGKYGWKKTLDDYAIDTVLLQPSMPLASILKISREWRLVYDDTRAVVFRRNGTKSLVPAGQARAAGSLVSSDERSIRDRAITKPNTQPKT